MQDTQLQTTPDAISWVAHYGTSEPVRQYDGDTKHFYEDMQRDDLIRFDLVDASGRVLIGVICDDRPELLFWRKRQYRDLATGSQLDCHLVGKKGEFVALVFPDGSVMMRHKFVPDDAYFDEPQPVKGEAWQI